MSAGIKGFRFSGIAAGLKQKGGRDLALAVADHPAVAAGVFTRNLVRAAPVQVAEARLARGTIRAVLANSGGANACTGAPGMQATLASTAAVAEALGIGAEEILPASTGVIGRLLPAERIVEHAGQLVAELGADNHAAFAEALMTTDRFPKVARAELAGGAALLGMAKGAGMIHPDLGDGLPHATMLAFLFTDAVVEHATLGSALMRAADDTFNLVSVDGDTSTNDTLVVLASGASGSRVGDAALIAGLTQVCDELARAMLADGEGAAHVAELRVHGLARDADARQVAKTMATSLLLKTALVGPDANWGRILAAAGRAGVRFDPDRARIVIGDAEIVRDGVATGPAADERATEVMRGPSYTIDVYLGDGAGTARYLTCDIGHPYVDVNAGYRT